MKYSSRKGSEHTYGGKLTQNVIEGVCRELLARALVGAELAGLAPVLHVHDEIAAEWLRMGIAEVAEGRPRSRRKRAEEDETG